MNGVSVSVHKFAVAQAFLGYNVRFWGITPSPKTHDYPIRNFQTELFASPKNRFALPHGLPERLADFSPADTVFHLHGGLLPVIWRVARLLSQRGFRYFYTPHGTFSEGAFQKGFFRKMCYLYLFEHGLMHRAEAVMVLGAGEQEFIGRHLPKVRQVMIPNGFDPLCTHDDIAERPAPEQPVFSFCGRLDRHHKGLDILLDGFAAYKKTGGSGRLVLIGGGSDEAFLKNRTAENGIAAAVEFTGPLFGNAKLAQLRESTAFVHSSRMEGFPMSVLEAAALGLPLIVSEFTNMGDFVRQWQTGWVLPKNDAENLSKTFHEAEKMLNNGSLRSIAHRALEMVEEEFLMEKIARDMVAMYRNQFVKNESCPQPALSLSLAN